MSMWVEDRHSVQRLIYHTFILENENTYFHNVEDKAGLSLFGYGHRKWNSDYQPQ